MPIPKTLQQHRHRARTRVVVANDARLAADVAFRAAYAEQDAAIADALRCGALTVDELRLTLGLSRQSIYAAARRAGQRERPPVLFEGLAGGSSSTPAADLDEVRRRD